MRDDGRASSNFERQANGQIIELGRDAGTIGDPTGSRPDRAGEDREARVLAPAGIGTPEPATKKHGEEWRVCSRQGLRASAKVKS